MAWTKFPDSPDLFPVSAGHEATGTRVPFTHWKVKVTCMSVSDISALLFSASSLSTNSDGHGCLSPGGPQQERTPLVYHYLPFVTFSKRLIEDNRWATKWPLLWFLSTSPPFVRRAQKSK